MAGSFRIVSHTADTGIEATAPTFAELLETLARGMVELMFDVAALQPTGAVEVSATGSDPADLAVGLLAELISVGEVDDVVPTACSVTRLARGEVTVRAATAPRVGVALRGPPVKAVTYHGLTVGRAGDGSWEARVIFDV